MLAAEAPVCTPLEAAMAGELARERRRSLAQILQVCTDACSVVLLLPAIARLAGLVRGLQARSYSNSGRE